MFKSIKQTVAGALAVVCFLSGSVLFNTTTANAATKQTTTPAPVICQKENAHQEITLSQADKINQPLPVQPVTKLTPKSMKTQYLDYKIFDNFTSQAASILHVDEQTIIDSLKQHISLVDIANHYGLSEQDLMERLQTLHIDKIDKAIPNGVITHDQGEKIKVQLPDLLKQMVETPDLDFDLTN